MSALKPVAPAKPAETIFLPAAKVLARYGRSNRSWLWRRLRDDQTFPRPIVIGGCNYWRVADLEAYEGSEARRVAAMAPALGKAEAA